MRITPQKRIKPLAGVFLYSFNFSLLEVIALYTDVMVYLDLILAA